MSTTIGGSSDAPIDRQTWAAQMAVEADENPQAARDIFDQSNWPTSESERFKRFADVVTYRWLDGKPEQWFPVPTHALDWHEQFRNTSYSPQILAGRKHTKTTWALCEILYELQYTPGYSVLYWCNNAENQLVARMTELEELIEANLWLDGLHRGNPNNQNNIPQAVKEKNFPNGSTLYGTSVGGGIEGSHVNMIIGDDPLKELGDISDEDIEHFYKHVIVPMGDSSDTNCIIGTRKRPKDIYHLIAESGYKLIEYPAIREPWLGKYGDRQENLADESLYTKVHAPELASSVGIESDYASILWPEARGVGFLRGKLGLQGKAAFKREFCMVFTHVEDAIIKRNLIDGPPASLTNPAPTTIEDVDTAFDRVAIGLDLALVEGGDNTAWCVVGANGEERWVLAVEYDDGIKPERIRRTTADLYDRFEADVIVVEKNGWQDWFADEAIQFESHLPIKKHTTTRRKHSWQRGVPKIASDIEAGRYRFYREDNGIEALIDGLCSLRLDDNDHLAGHTPDVVMALYMATKGLSSGSGSVLDLSGEGSERVQERKDDQRAKEEKFRGNAIGEAFIDQNNRRQEFR